MSLADHPDRLRWNGRWEPVSLLPAGFTVVDTQDLPDNERGTKRRLLARREAAPGPVRE